MWDAFDYKFLHVQYSDYHKDAEPLYHAFMYSLVLILSRIYPLPAMHSLLVKLDISVINYLPRCTYPLF